MTRHKMFLGLLVCFSIASFVGQSLSQSGRPYQSSRMRRSDGWPHMETNEWLEYVRRRDEQREKLWEMQRERQRKQMDEQVARATEESMRQTLGASYQQWRIIKPRYDRLKVLKEQAAAQVGIILHRSEGDPALQGYKPIRDDQIAQTPSDKTRERMTTPQDSEIAQSDTRVRAGWKWSRPSARESPNGLSKAETACEELLDVLEDEQASLEEIEQKVEALRRLRSEAARQVPEAQQELRKVLTLDQEATLVLMGWLD
jgi:Spy/CpxP family protein refolding chaperone